MKAGNPTEDMSSEELEIYQAARISGWDIDKSRSMAIAGRTPPKTMYPAKVAELAIAEKKGKA